MRSIALAQVALEKDYCPVCKGRRSKCTNEHLEPIIESLNVECRDDAVLEKHRQAFHQQNRHVGSIDQCEVCADRHFYVAGYREITPGAGSQT